MSLLSRCVVNRAISQRFRVSAAQRAQLVVSRANHGGVFPREREGNDYSMNYSLLEDQITPVGDVFRNARVATLVARLADKPANSVVKVTGPAYIGSFQIKEWGDSISADDYFDFQETARANLSSGCTIFAEDAGLGAHSSIRVACRVLTSDPALSLIFRKLMV